MADQKSNESNKYLNTNIRPIFMSNYGKWDKGQRIYVKMLPEEENIRCIQTCTYPIEGINDQQKNIEQCIGYCNKYIEKQMTPSASNSAIKKYCVDFNFSQNKDFECVKTNKSKIYKDIRKTCGDDEVCNTINRSIINLIINKNKPIKENYYTGSSDYRLLIIICIICVIIFIFVVLIIKNILKDK